MLNDIAKHGEIANHFNKKFNLSIDRSTVYVSKILTKKEKWLDLPPSKQTSSTFCQCSVKYPKLDKAMELWVSQAIAARLPLSDKYFKKKDVILRKASIVTIMTSNVQKAGFTNLKKELVFIK